MRSRSSTSTPTWVWLVGAFAVLIIWQGAFRKWWLPALETPLYVMKDVVLVGAILLYGARYGFHLAKPLRHTMLPILWGGLGFIAALQMFNFQFPSLLGSMMGLRSYMLYTSLLILLPPIMERIQNPKKFLTWVVMLGILPVLVLGYYQYGQPVDAWINRYVAEDANVVGVSGRPRITGTFSYIGGMGSFLSFSVFFAIGVFLAGLKYQDRWYTWLGGIFLAAALVVAPMNGSRSVVMGILVPLPFVLYTVFQGKRGISVFVLTALLALGGNYAINQSEWATQGWETVGQRIEGGQESGEQEARFRSIIRDPVEKIGVSGLLGYGTGGTNNAAVALAGYSVNPGVGSEGEMGRVIIELGTIGGLFFFLLKAWLAWTAWQALTRARTAWTTLLSITVFSNLFLTLISGMIVFNHIAGSLYWICAGIAVWLWSRQEVCIQSLRHSSRTTHPHG